MRLQRAGGLKYHPEWHAELGKVAADFLGIGAGAACGAAVFLECAARRPGMLEGYFYALLSSYKIPKLLRTTFQWVILC